MFQNAELTVREYLDILKRRRWFIAAVTIILTALGTIPIALQPAVYASTAQIQLRVEQSAFSDDAAANEMNRMRNLETDVNVIASPEIRALVVERLGPDGESFDDVVAAVSGFSELIDITVTAPSAVGAQEAANAYAEVYVEELQRGATGTLLTQETELRAQSEQLQRRQGEVDRAMSNPAIDPFTLENLRQERAQLATQIAQYDLRADQLAVDAGLREQAYSVASRAPLEMTPVAPKPFQAAAIAMAIGLLIGIGLAVFLEIFQDRITTSTELETIDAELPVMASVPHVDVDLDDPDSRLPALATEAFRYLWTTLRFRSHDRPIRTLVITSSLSGEGKTTTAINLARTVADSGSKVVLIDADMRKAAVHTRIGIDNDHGLSGLITGESTFDEAVDFVRPNLAVLSAGRPLLAATDLLGDQRFMAMVDALRTQSDLVIIDAPPVLPVADALLAARGVDAMLVVGRLGSVRRRDLRQTLRRIRDAGIPVIGFVANDSSVSQYGNYYSDYTDAEPARVDA